MSVKYFKTIVLSIMIVGLCSLSITARAETKIGVVNIQEIMSESKAAKSIQKQLDTHREAFQKEFSKHERSLVDQEKGIIESRAELSSEEFSKKRQDFEAKLLETRKLVQKRQRSLELAAGESLKVLRVEVVKIVAELADSEDYDIILTRQNVILAHKSMDITSHIMTRLNKSLKTIELKVKTN